MGEFESLVERFFGGSSLVSRSGYLWRWTGKGSVASCITYPSITWVSTLGLIIALGRPPLSVTPLLGWGKLLLLIVLIVLVTVGSAQFEAGTDVGGGIWIPLMAVLVGGGTVGSSPFVLMPVVAETAAAVVAADVAVTVAILAAAADVVVVIAGTDETELVVVVSVVVVVVVCGVVVVVLTAPAGSSDEGTDA